MRRTSILRVVLAFAGVCLASDSVCALVAWQTGSWPAWTGIVSYAWYAWAATIASRGGVRAGVAAGTIVALLDVAGSFVLWLAIRRPPNAPYPGNGLLLASAIGAVVVGVIVSAVAAWLACRWRRAPVG